MITTLKIEGFKSFGTPPQRLHLGRLNFVVGANASGKTNLISVLRFLQHAVRENVEYAVGEFGGASEVRNRILRERNRPKPVSISLRIEPRQKIRVSSKVFTIAAYDYSLIVDLRNDAGRPVIASEKLDVKLHDDDDKEFLYQLTRAKEEIGIRDEIGLSPKGLDKVTVPEVEATRLALGVGFFSLPLAVLRDIILNWRFYNLSPERARTPTKDIPDADLGPHGENLAVILHKIEQLNGKGALDSIIAGLKGAVPGFKKVKTLQLPVEGKWAFQVLEEKIKGAINPDSVSDGTIRLLALMVIAHWSTRDSSLLVIEEPENGLHPHLSEHVVNVLRTASERRQVIATTHNPTFLDYINPDEVVLCDKVEGFTKLRKATDVAQIEHFRKQFRLGELWIQGTLGGIP